MDGQGGANGGSAALSIRGLGKRFGDRVAFENVSFDVGLGEVFGFLGPNGAGKTTTMRTLGTLIEPTSGSATVAGIPLKPENGVEIRKRIDVMPESPGLYLRLSVAENLGCFADLYEVPDPRDRIDRALRAVHLANRARDACGTLSKGLRQRVALARALLADPEVLFLDEPTAGLDPAASRDVHGLIDDLRKRGVTSFATSCSPRRSRSGPSHRCQTQAGSLPAWPPSTAGTRTGRAATSYPSPSQRSPRQQSPGLSSPPAATCGRSATHTIRSRMSTSSSSEPRRRRAGKMRMSTRRVRAIFTKELREYRRNGSIVVAMAVILFIFLIQPLIQVFAVPASASTQLRHEASLLYLLAIPAIVPALVAAYAVVGERQQGTLEPALTTPLLAAWSIWVGIGISARSNDIRVAQQLGMLASLPTVAVTSLTRIVHSDGSSADATSEAVKNSSGSGGRAAVVFRSAGL